MLNVNCSRIFVDYFGRILLGVVVVLCSASVSASTRVYSDKDLTLPLKLRVFDDTKVIAFYIDACVTREDVSITETERSTRIASDIKLIRDVVVSGKAITQPCGADEKRPVKKEYPLKFGRSEVKLKAASLDGGDVEELTVITGPREHLYLGIDLPVTKSKTLKYDSGSHSLVPKDSSSQLYLSINYFLGDDLFVADSESPGGRFNLKAMISIQSRPLDSVGLGIGYRLPKIGALDLNSFEIFGGRFWTKQDQVASGGGVELNGATKREWLLGVSYNLSEGLAWVKKK